MDIPVADERLVFDADLIRKYDRFGPRYTSYPSADRFTPAYDADAYRAGLERRAGHDDRAPFSLYFHIPFCNTVCFYCGCNKVITKNRTRSVEYVDYVLREIEMVTRSLPDRPRVTQLHWGGGTPTFLPQPEMVRLMGATRDAFALDPAGENSIEVDPRKVDRGMVELLAELGFNRISLGVQDFDQDVQRAVNRIQSEAETRAVIDAARENRFRSVSIDLIYGLPRQTLAGFERTIDRVLDASPDRLAIYNYAHLPSLFKPQRNIHAHELPSPEVKLDILHASIERLTRAGYVYIGMDHFAKPDDDLAIAQRNGRLQRNFQGYSTHADTDLVAFGVSAIGRIADSYGQNAKTLDDYYARIDRGELPVFRGYTLNADDVVRRWTIQALMCRGEVDYAEFRRVHGTAFGTYYAVEAEDLAALADDGLVAADANGLRVLPRGRLLVRNVAMVFDRYLRARQPVERYSKTI
jgi:oxygen-independent coproporphyrinogen III oxidase